MSNTDLNYIAPFKTDNILTDNLKLNVDFIEFKSGTMNYNSGSSGINYINVYIPLTTNTTIMSVAGTQYPINNVFTLNMASNFTNNGAGLLTYTGSQTIKVLINASVSCKLSSGGPDDVLLLCIVNGIANVGSYQHKNIDNANYSIITMSAIYILSTNNTVRLYLQSSGTNNIITKTCSFTINQI